MLTNNIVSFEQLGPDFSFIRIVRGYVDLFQQDVIFDYFSLS